MSEKNEMTTREESLEKSRKNIPVVTPPVDIYANEDEILLFADMPGVRKENITINVDNGKLDISAVRDIKSNGAAIWEEFGNVEFRRSFSVPQSIDLNRVDAELTDGVLRLHLPKSDAAKPRVIQIK